MITKFNCFFRAPSLSLNINQVKYVDCRRAITGFFQFNKKILVELISWTIHFVNYCCRSPNMKGNIQRASIIVASADFYAILPSCYWSIVTIYVIQKTCYRGKNFESIQCFCVFLFLMFLLVFWIQPLYIYLWSCGYNTVILTVIPTRACRGLGCIVALASFRAGLFKAWLS